MMLRLSRTFSPAMLSSSPQSPPRWSSVSSLIEMVKLAVLRARICGKIIEPKPVKVRLRGTEIMPFKGLQGG